MPWWHVQIIFDDVEKDREIERERKEEKERDSNTVKKYNK